MKYLYGTAVMAAALASGAHAQNIDSGLVDTALEFLSRASSTSEVLTLNLTNLLILLVLKAIIFGFGLFSVSGAARSSDSATTTFVTESELTGIMCLLMYYAGEDDKLSCVKKSACEDPKTASDYTIAAEMLIPVFKIFRMSTLPQHELVLNGIGEAMERSISGGDCNIYRW